MTIAIIPKFANVGAGAGLVFQAENKGNDVELRSLVAGSNIGIASAAGEVTISATGGASSTYWEDVLRGYDFRSGNMSWTSIYATGPATEFGFWESESWETAGSYHMMHENYSGGTIQARLLLLYKNATTSPDNETWRIYGRWLANDNDYDVAYSNYTEMIIAYTSGARRMLISSLYNFTPDGSWAAGKGLSLKVYRYNGVSDYPAFGALKLRYPITL